MTGDRALRRVLLGHVAGAHGIRGAVLIKSYTGEPSAIADYGPLSDESGLRTFEISVEGGTAKGLICRIDGVSDRTQAEALKGTALYVERARLPPTEAGEYYHTDLIGLAVVTDAGAALGTVIAVQNFGAGDLLEVKPDSARGSVLYAMTEDVVRDVDLVRGVIVLAPPEEVDAGDAAGDSE
jgi:16S rRNA processing protein RimM